MKISRNKIMLCLAAQNLTCKALANKIGMQANNLSTVLSRGSCQPITAARIAEGLGVAVEQITEG